MPTAAAGNALLKAVEDASNRKVVGQLTRSSPRAPEARLQANIDEAINGPHDRLHHRQRRDHEVGPDGAARARQAAQGGRLGAVAVGGYTDNVGDAKANLKLSQARAHSVVVFLDEARRQRQGLVAKGYGEAKPIAPNTTEAGRQKNRRIEFTVLSG